MKASLQDWIHFRNPQYRYTGWKIHVSTNRREAQEALAALAVTFGIAVFKFAHDLPTLQKGAQAGKTAVFYHTEKTIEDAPIDWAAFIAEAERIVLSKGGPGAAVQRDRRVPGTCSVFYRNDQDRDGGYVKRYGITSFAKANGIPEERIFNLGGHPDPFAHVEIKNGTPFIDGKKHDYVIPSAPLDARVNLSFAERIQNWRSHFHR